MLHCIALLLSILWEEKKKKAKTILQLFATWECSPWRSLGLLVYSSVCRFKLYFCKMFWNLPRTLPTSLVLGVNVKPLIITIMILRNCVSLFLLKIKVYTAVTLACLSRSVNVYIHWSTSANPYEHKPNVMLIMYFMWVVFWMSNRDLSL